MIGPWADLVGGRHHEEEGGHDVLHCVGAPGYCSGRELVKDEAIQATQPNEVQAYPDDGKHQGVLVV